MSTRTRLALSSVTLAALALGAAACSDVTSVSGTPAAGTPRSALSASEQNSRVLSQTRVGDTTVTVFVVGTNSTGAKSFGLGDGNKIEFPYSASSICSVGSSSYGAGTWDDACAPSSEPVQITARVWRDAKGLPRTDFQPAMRFVPGLSQSVTLYLHALNNAPNSKGKAYFCDASGTCVDESATDPSLATTIDPSNGFWVRKIKHFSGYNVLFGLIDDVEGVFSRSGYITTTGAARPDAQR